MQRTAPMPLVAPKSIDAVHRAIPKKRSTTGGVLYLCGDVISESLSGRTRWNEVVQLTADQVLLIGNQSLGLLLVTGLATGAVMAAQFANGLQRFGGALYVPQLVGLTVLRELGPVLASLLLAGRVGSGITSELASMNVTEQIDAIRALGDSTGTLLVLPRILACLIAFPILTLFCDAASVASAMVLSWKDLSIEPSFYLSKTIEGIEFADVWTGLIKSLVFAFFISTVSCWKGLNTSGGTQGVGKATTWTVVTSSIFVLVSDYFMSKMFILTVFRR